MGRSPLCELYYGRKAEVAIKKFEEEQQIINRETHSFIDPAPDKPCIIDMTSTYTRGKKVFFK